MTTENVLVETQIVTRLYGFRSVMAIIDTPNHGRIMIEDGFGGMDTLEGGCVHWRHGSAYQLLPGDTFASLEAERWGDGMTLLYAVVTQSADSRRYLGWSGDALAAIAKSVWLN